MITQPKFCSVCGQLLNLIYAKPWFDMYTGELIDTWIKTIECPLGHKEYKRGQFIPGFYSGQATQFWDEVNTDHE